MFNVCLGTNIVYSSKLFYSLRMDALSDVLRLIRLSSCVYFRSDFFSPWGMKVDEGKFAQFHIVTSGKCVLKRSGNFEPIMLSSSLSDFPREICENHSHPI